MNIPIPNKNRLKWENGPLVLTHQVSPESLHAFKGLDVDLVLDVSSTRSEMGFGSVQKVVGPETRSRNFFASYSSELESPFDTFEDDYGKLLKKHGWSIRWNQKAFHNCFSKTWGAFFFPRGVSLQERVPFPVTTGVLARNPSFGSIYFFARKELVAKLEAMGVAAPRLQPRC